MSGAGSFIQVHICCTTGHQTGENEEVTCIKYKNLKSADVNHQEMMRGLLGRRENITSRVYLDKSLPLKPVEWWLTFTGNRHCFDIYGHSAHLYEQVLNV